MVPRSAEWDRVVPGLRCGTEECRVGPSSAGRGWGNTTTMKG